MHVKFASHRQYYTLVVAIHAGVHKGGRTEVPKAADNKKRANGSHASPKPLRQVDVARYDTPRNEQVERCQVADRVESLREQLKVLVCALVTTAEGTRITRVTNLISSDGRVWSRRHPNHILRRGKVSTAVKVPSFPRVPSSV